MKATSFNKERKALHHLVLHATDNPENIGLLDGQTGIMLVLAHYARVRKLPVIEKAADFLMENILRQLTRMTSAGFAQGLAGIGWGMEYLIQNGYMQGSGAELCHEIDQRLMEQDVRRISEDSLENGLLGLSHYVTAHMQGAAQSGLCVFDKTYIADFMEAIRRRAQKEPETENWHRHLQQLEAAATGVTDGYTMSLSPFIHTGSAVAIQNLGLSKGIAGYIETQLEKDEVS